MSGTEEFAAIAEGLDLEESGLAGTWMGAMVLIVRGRLRAAAMDHTGAVPFLRSAHEIARGLSMGPAVAPTGSLLALSLPPLWADRARLHRPARKPLPLHPPPAV